MDERLEDLFRQSIGRTQERYHLELTNRAIFLLHFAIESIQDEQDPRWPLESRGDPRRIQERAIERLPELLRWVARSRGSEWINSFLVLEVAPQLIAMLCIWELPPG
jgi:hypothetical protein